MKPHRQKQTNAPVTKALLASRRDSLKHRGYAEPKWVKFCAVLLNRGYTLTLYEARQTCSKYITVSKEGRPPFKVRFSNHKPILARELRGDCDYFVGITNLGVTHVGMALTAVEQHFRSHTAEDIYA